MDAVAGRTRKQTVKFVGIANENREQKDKTSKQDKNACSNSMATTIVDAVLEELKTRKGFTQWFDEIDGDIQSDIVEGLIDTVNAEL